MSNIRSQLDLSKPKEKDSKTRYSGRKDTSVATGSKIISKNEDLEPLENIEQIDRISVEPLIAVKESPMAEQFRKLRSVMNVHYLANFLRSILVTSLIPGEGKTTVSLNLATFLAKAGNRPVFLLDADLHKKGLTSLLGLQVNQGLSDLLDSDISLQQVMVRTEIENLHFIPAGSLSMHVSELIASNGMTDLLRKLKTLYQDSYIVIDSPPIIPTSDANVLASIVDGILLVVMAEETRRDIMKRELLSLKKDKILGVVLNCAKFEASYYHHRYYQNYFAKKNVE